jgi:hypothetical protein
MVSRWSTVLIVSRVLREFDLTLLSIVSGQLRWPSAYRYGTDGTDRSDRLDARHSGRDSRFPARKQAWQPPFDGVGNKRVLCPWSRVTRLSCARQTSQTAGPALLKNGGLAAGPL